MTLFHMASRCLNLNFKIKSLVFLFDVFFVAITKLINIYVIKQCSGFFGQV